ncbi:Outer membrane protein (porin) [Roseateles sp. YR242]|uniref:porin n=1 Tax=Roseateles sp. YR242 TaxID=1855305 RepID=UPI0008CF436B|nr:porin [Roseateles sp. YR242]SEK64892.1 Outer membrane protein (porin) [Roseateles sp. YR242]
MNNALTRRLTCIGGLALLTCGDWAQAQSSLTIYGIIDQGITKANRGTTAGAMLPGRAAPDIWTIKAGNTSRLGFRGREELGGGSYARFQMEHRVALDTGTPSNPNVFWLGRSVVAIGDKQWGEVYTGREYSPVYWIALFADPTALSYVGQLGTTYTYANYTAVAASVEASNNRWSNSVGYKSPTWKGMSVEVATALGERARKRNDSANIQYRDGPVWLAAGTDRMDSRNNMSIVAAGYDFGVVFPTATYSRARGGLAGDATSYALAVRVPLSFGRAYGSYGKLRPADSRDAAMVGTGVEYDLSKRSLLYANLGSAKRDSFSRTTAFDAGFKHTF